MVSADTTKVEAINTMLALIGAASVNSLENQVDEDVVLAIATLNEVDRQVQGTGWHFNTDLDQILEEDDDGRHPWQEDWMQVDVPLGKHTSLDLTRRNGFLHDRCSGSNLLKTPKLTVNITRRLAWEDMPEQARGFIFTRAARIFLSRSVGDETRAGYAVDDENQARRALVEWDAQQGDFSIFATGPAPYVRHRPGGSGLRTGGLIG